MLNSQYSADYVSGILFAAKLAREQGLSSFACDLYESLLNPEPYPDLIRKYGKRAVKAAIEGVSRNPGQKIANIKHVREMTVPSLDLREAKDLVEEIMNRCQTTNQTKEQEDI